MGSCDRSQPSGVHQTQRASIIKRGGEPLQIPVSLAPTIPVNDIGERHTAHRPEPAHGVADRQQGIGVDFRRKAQSGFRFGGS